MELAEIISQEQEQYAKESAIYDKMRVLASGLHVPIVEMVVGLKVQDKQTGEIKTSRKFHVQSYTRNMYAWATSMPVGFNDGASYADGSLAYKDILDNIVSGANFHYTDNLENGGVGYDADANQSLWGALAGRGSTAFSIDDNDIELLITHGTGPNQMEYAASILSEGWNAGSQYYWSIHSRTIDNNSAASITVWEVGLVAKSDEPSTFKYYLLARDVIAGGQVVTTSDRLIVDYETRVNF